MPHIESLRPHQLQCEKCGSTHFVEAPFKQYRQQYSAAPGGDISSNTENPIRALVCLCGHPILPGRLRSYALADFKSFQKAFEAARKYRESISLEATLRKAAELYASRHQHDVLAERIAHMETILKEITPFPQPSTP